MSSLKDNRLDKDKAAEKFGVSAGKSTPKDVLDAAKKVKDDHGHVVSLQDAPGTPVSDSNSAKSSANGTSQNNKVPASEQQSHTDKQRDLKQTNEALKTANAKREAPSIPGANKIGADTSDAPKPDASGATANADPSKPSKSIPQARIDKKAQLENIGKKKDPVPDFVGWKEVGGWDDRHVLEDDEEVQDIQAKSTLLEDYVKDKFYGDWYHNVVLIVLTSLFSWLVARLGGGLPWLVIVLLFTGTIYRTSIRRLRQRYRDDITREFGLKKLESDTESLEWLNSFLIKFWLIYEPVLSETVIAIGNQTLKDACPGFIESLSLDTFTLGTKPPRIDHVRTFPKTDDDVAVMDWKFSFTPNDIEDLTARQLKSKVNPKIQLGVRIGKGVVSKSLPILVEDMSFAGLMRVRIKMMSTFPHVQTVDVSFLEPPLIDYVLKPIGGETLGFDINVIPGLSKFIREMIDSNAGPMIYAPNAFQLNVEQMLAGAGVDSAIGVLTIKIKNANSLKGSDRLGNTVDPYIKFFIGENTPELARSETKSDTKDPVWNETKHLLVKNLNDVLRLELVDFNDVRKDKSIGWVNFHLESLTEKPDQDNIKGEVLAGGKPRGGLIYDASFTKVLESRTLDDGRVLPPPECNTGILRITVAQARDLDAKKSLVGQLSTYADIAINGEVISSTKTIKKNNSPVWGQSKEVLVADKARGKVTITVKDSRGVSTDPIIGKIQLPINSIVASVERGNEWFDLSPVGKIKLNAVWKPVPIKDLDSSGGYIEPLGIFRIGIKRARDLRNLERVGKIDPYVRLFVGGFAKARTLAADSTTNPDFNEVFYLTTDNISQEITVEAMDVEKLGKDRTLGSFRIDPSKYIRSGSDGKYLEYRGNGKELSGDLEMDKKSPKGKVFFTLDFFPAVNVLSPEQVEEKRKKEEEAAEQAKIEAEENKGKKKPDPKEKDDDDSEDEEDDLQDDPQDDIKTNVDGPEGIEMSLDEQLTKHSGIIGIIVEEVNGNPRDTYLRAKYDNFSTPIYASGRLRGSKNKLTESFDFMVRELEYSETVLEIVSKPLTTDTDDILYTANISTMKIMRETFQQSKSYKLNSKNGNGGVTVTIRSRYFPVDYPLDPSESVMNQGKLRLDILDAQDLEAADRSGKSDPYAKIFLNGKQIYKTKEIKKTLNPVWNEFVEVDVPSRTDGVLEIQVYDFDIGPGDDDFLGKNVIDLPKLEPLDPIVLILPMDGHSGSIRVRAKFTPQYLRAVGTKKGTTLGTISGTIGVPGKMLMDVGGAPVKVVGNVGGVAAGVASGGVGKVKGLFGRKKEDKSSSTNGTASADTSANYDTSSITSSPARGQSHKRTTSISSQTSSVPNGSETVAGNLGLIGLEGVDPSAGHVQLKISVQDKKERDIYKSKSFKATDSIKVDDSIPFKTSGTATLVFKLREVHSLGRHTDIAEGTIDLASTEPGAVSVDIGNAQLSLQLAYNAA